MKYFLTTLIYLFFSQCTLAQSSYFPRDTTYSIASATQKMKKKHRNITVVSANLPRQVESFPNLVYLALENDRKLHLDIFKPKKRKHKKRPAVLMIHGGGWIKGSKENVVPMAQQLAKKGYVTVAVEYRLGDESGFPAAVCDLRAAVRWLRAAAETYNIDTTKIAVYGCSAGAHLATFLGTTNDKKLFDEPNQNTKYAAKVQAVLNIDGIVSFIHPEAKPEWTGYSANAWLGDYKENYKRWKSASPLEYADNNTPPILFVNSSKPRFHAGRDDLIRILDEHKIYHQERFFENSPHGFWFVEPWFEPTLKYCVRFLRKVF